MALQQREIIDKKEFLESGAVNIRKRIEIYDDSTGKIVSTSFHRESFGPDGWGDDRASELGIKRLCDIEWTEVKRAIWKEKAELKR